MQYFQLSCAQEDKFNINMLSILRWQQVQQLFSVLYKAGDDAQE